MIQLEIRQAMSAEQFPNHFCKPEKYKIVFDIKALSRKLILIFSPIFVRWWTCYVVSNDIIPRRLINYIANFYTSLYFNKILGARINSWLLTIQQLWLYFEFKFCYHCVRVLIVFPRKIEIDSFIKNSAISSASNK